MVAEIVAAIKLIYELVSAARELVVFVKEHKEEKWFQDSAEIFSKWREAKTTDDKKAIIRGVADLWRRI